MGLREHRERFGLTQADVIAEVRRLALARGDRGVPGVDQPALSKHENGQKRPGPYYQALYCEVYGATPADLGFRVALPYETRKDADVNRREFLAGVAGVAASTVTGPPARVGGSDIEHLRRSTAAFRTADAQQGSASVYGLATRHFQRLRGLVERGRYDQATGLALRELAGQTAQQAGWLAFDGIRHDVARRWWLEGLHWAQLAAAEGQSVRVSIMATMARQ